MKVSSKSSNFIVIKTFSHIHSHDTRKVDKEETQEFSNQGQNKEKRNKFKLINLKKETSRASLIRQKEISD